MVGQNNGRVPPTPGTTLPLTTPSVFVDFRVTPDATVPNTIAFSVEVRILEQTGNPAEDTNPAIATGMRVRTYPVKKLCNPRLDASRRGEYR